MHDRLDCFIKKTVQVYPKERGDVHRTGKKQKNSEGIMFMKMEILYVSVVCIRCVYVMERKTFLE